MCVGLKIPYIQECFGILKVHEMAVTLKIEFESTHHVGVKISVCNRILIVSRNVSLGDYDGTPPSNANLLYCIQHCYYCSIA